MRLALFAAFAAVALGCGEDRRPAAAHPAPAPGQVIEVDDENYAAVVGRSEKPVLALFWAPWSGPDKIVKPYMAEVARERPGLTVVTIDVDEAPATADRHDVLAIPSTILLVDGEPRAEVSGAAGRRDWERRLRLDAVAPRP